jgi:hypothetical protein
MTDSDGKEEFYSNSGSIDLPERLNPKEPRRISPLSTDAPLQECLNDNMKEVSLENWIRNKSKCSALYPFEITKDGNIKISNANECWIVDDSSDMGWLVVRKMSVSGIDDQEVESLIPIKCLEKCTLFERRFLLQESPSTNFPPDSSRYTKEDERYDNAKMEPGKRAPPPPPPPPPPMI